MSSRHIMDLHDISSEDVMIFGGKATNLSLLHKHGFNVPKGFAVSGHYFAQMIDETEGARELIERLDGTDDFEDMLEISTNLQVAITNTPLPDVLVQQLNDFFSNLRRKTESEFGFAVRSSSSVEDGKEISFAGQAKTYLCIKDIEDMLASVKKVWLSALSPQAIIYLNTKGVPISQVRMGIVVQEMVNAGISGVLFTANVVDNNREQMLVEATWGLGEALVGGNVVPDTYIIERKTFTPVSKSLGSKKVTFIQGDGCTVRTDTPQKKCEMFTLSNADLKKLVESGIEIENKMGCPQDVEWCISEGEIVVLQSRPITTLRCYS